MKCPNCKEKYHADDKFCLNCGYDLSQSTESEMNKQSSKGKTVLALFAIASVLIFIFVLNSRRNKAEELVIEEAAIVAKKEEEDAEKKSVLLEQADEAIEDKNYDEAVVHLEDALAIESDETTEGLKEIAAQMEKASNLYIEDDLSEAYDELRDLLFQRKEGAAYTVIYQQAEELKDEIKASHAAKWARILARGGEWDFDEQRSLLDLEFGDEHPEHFENNAYGRLINDFLTYLDNDFVEAHLFHDEEFINGIYLFFEREESTAGELVGLAEEVVEMGIPVRFYTKSRDQTIANLAGQIGRSEHDRYFSEDAHYHAIVKGGQETDINSPYLTKETPEAVIAYLKQVLEDGQY